MGEETPYGSFLEERLGTRARVRVSGICGEVTGEMVLRFRDDVLTHKPEFVVILGGTNDLGMNAQPAEVMRNLLKMYELALAGSIQPIAMTIPSLRPEGPEEIHDASEQEWLRSHVDRRAVLNRLITEYCTRRTVPSIDLFAATVDPRTGFLAAPYSNDGLHLTTPGYRLIATLLYEQIFKPRLV